MTVLANSIRVTITHDANGKSLVAIICDAPGPIRLKPDQARQLAAEIIAVSDHLDPRTSRR